MLAAARRATGLEDMGGDHFMAPMQQLIANLDQRKLTALGKVSTRAVALKHLTNRLCLTEHFRQHPTLNDLPIERPVFIGRSDGRTFGMFDALFSGQLWSFCGHVWSSCGRFMVALWSLWYTKQDPR